MLFSLCLKSNQGYIILRVFFSTKNVIVIFVEFSYEDSFICLIYRKFEIYNMSWNSDVSLNTVTLTCASFGGPIAVMRDRSKIVKVQGSGKPVIAIYTSSGKLISSLVVSFYLSNFNRKQF